MKKRFLILAFAIFANIVCFSEKTFEDVRYRYVNTLDGVNLRDKPNGRKIGVLKYNERVEYFGTSTVISEIDDWKMPWIKVRTKDGNMGYIYGAYLSRSLKFAAEFRVWEALHPMGEWFDEMAKWFSDSVNLDSDMRNVTSFDDEDSYRIQDESIDFLFFPTKNEKTGKTGFYLVRADIYSTNACRWPESFPIKTGDSIEKVEEIFGEPNGSYHSEYERKVYEAFGTFTIVEMIFFYDDNGIIDRSRLQLSPEW